MTTPLGQTCSDIGQPEITDINVCKEAQQWMQVLEFVDQSNNPDPEMPRRCFHDWGFQNPERVVWNPGVRGTPHEEMKAICLNSGKYILFIILSHIIATKTLVSMIMYQSFSKVQEI